MKKSLKEPYHQFFGTLANQVRLDIVKSLIAKDLNVSQISSETDYEQSTVSHNLKRLEECGFVTVTQEGKTRIYSLNTVTIKPLFELMENHVNSFCKHVIAKKGKQNEHKENCH